MNDQDFLSDLVKQFTGDSRRDRSWTPLMEIFQNSYDLSWPEACLQALRMNHVVVTPQELVDDFRKRVQGEGTEEKYLTYMKTMAKGLTGVLDTKEALLHAATSLNEVRIKIRVEEMVKSDKITSFTELINQVMRLRDLHVGDIGKGKAPVRKQSVNYANNDGYCNDCQVSVQEVEFDPQAPEATTCHYQGAQQSPGYQQSPRQQHQNLSYRPLAQQSKYPQQQTNSHFQQSHRSPNLQYQGQQRHPSPQYGSQYQTASPQAQAQQPTKILVNHDSLKIL